MTYPGAFGRYARRAVAVASLFLAGCSSVRPCPASGFSLFRVPATQANPIVSVSADAPCTATLDSRATVVYLSRLDSGICRGRAELANGDTYTFSVEFRTVDTGDCGALTYAFDASFPALIDGGQD
jgi:hypothetical protein